MLRRRGAFSLEPLRGRGPVSSRGGFYKKGAPGRTPGTRLSAMWGGSRAVWKRRFSCYGPCETAESCVVHTSASVYRRLQESPRQPPGGMSAWDPPTPPTHSPHTPLASGRLLKSESEDSGVEMASNEHSPSTPSLGSESSFSLDGFPPEKNPPGGEAGPAKPPCSRSASKKLVQATQRSRRQRVPGGRCPRQLGRRGPSGGDPWEGEELGAKDPEGEAMVPGQGLRYLEHVCQMLERLARLQQDNRLLRQQAMDARRTLPDATPPPAAWRGERFRPRSCSDSQAPAPDPVQCQRMWGHSASSPSLLDPSQSGATPPTPDKDGRSHWGRVKVLLTRLTRRSLRGGRCR